MEDEYAGMPIVVGCQLSSQPLILLLGVRADRPVGQQEVLARVEGIGRWQWRCWRGCDGDTRGLDDEYAGMSIVVGCQLSSQPLILLLGVRVQNGQLNSKKTMPGLKKAVAGGGEAGKAAAVKIEDTKTNMRVCLS